VLCCAVLWFFARRDELEGMMDPFMARLDAVLRVALDGSGAAVGLIGM
jgi:hypothetical protein